MHMAKSLKAKKTHFVFFFYNKENFKKIFIYTF